MRIRLTAINAIYEQTSCDICNDEDWTEDNKIVICELCNVHVHQECYGSELLKEVPEGPWYCQRCQKCLEGKVVPEEIKCKYCPNLEGALKLINGTIWVHVACVDLIPEIYFEEDGKKEKILEIEKIPPSRLNVKCCLCGVKQGAAIPCDYKGCTKKFHAKCAIKGGLLEDKEIMEGLKRYNSDGEYYPIFCRDHLKEISTELDQGSAKSTPFKPLCYKDEKEKCVPQKGRKRILAGNETILPKRKAKKVEPEISSNHSLTIKMKSDQEVSQESIIRFLKRYEDAHEGQSINVTIEFP